MIISIEQYVISGFLEIVRIQFNIPHTITTIILYFQKCNKNLNPKYQQKLLKPIHQLTNRQFTKHQFTFSNVNFYSVFFTIWQYALS